MGHQYIRAGGRHLLRFVLVEDIRTRQHAQFMSLPDHLHFETVAHTRLLQVLAKRAIEESDCREILHASETQLL